MAGFKGSGNDFSLSRSNLRFRPGSFPFTQVEHDEATKTQRTSGNKSEQEEEDLPCEQHIGMVQILCSDSVSLTGKNTSRLCKIGFQEHSYETKDDKGVLRCVECVPLLPNHSSC